VRNFDLVKGFLQLSGGGVLFDRTVLRNFGRVKGFLQLSGGGVLFDRTVARLK